MCKKYNKKMLQNFTIKKTIVQNYGVTWIACQVPDYKNIIKLGDYINLYKSYLHK